MARLRRMRLVQCWTVELEHMAFSCCTNNSPWTQGHHIACRHASAGWQSLSTWLAFASDKDIPRDRCARCQSGGHHMAHWRASAGLWSLSVWLACWTDFSPTASAPHGLLAYQCWMECIARSIGQRIVPATDVRGANGCARCWPQGCIVWPFGVPVLDVRAWAHGLLRQTEDRPCNGCRCARCLQ